jgi:hypothetical protein
MDRYYYLIYSLFFLTLLVLGLIKRRDLFKYTYPAILFGIVAGPFCQLLYMMDYWQPTTVLGYARISIEDCIFGASIFGLAFVLYPLAARRSFLVPKVNSRLQHKRFVICMLIGSGIFAAMSQLGVNTVITTSSVFLGLWLGISWQRRDLFMPGLLAGLGFILLALFVYGAGFSLIPSQVLSDAWLLYGQPLGLTIAGKVPVTELVWFFSVGCFLSVFDLFTSGKYYIQRDHDIGGRPSSRASRSSKAGTPEST